MSTRVDKPLAEMQLRTLTEYCTREIAKYRRGEESDDRYCLEVFRRAIVQRDNEAWITLRNLFSENVRLWLSRHPSREIALRHEIEQNYIDDTFRRFWQALNGQPLNFSNLGGALYYLKCCLNTAVADTLRTYTRKSIEKIPEQGHPDEPQVEDKYHEDEVWETINSLLPGEKERRLAYLHFHCNLKAREIIRRCPGEFSGEEEIYRLKRNIVERIQRNAEKLRWRLGSPGS